MSPTSEQQPNGSDEHRSNAGSPIPGLSGANDQQNAGADPDAKRKKLVWESILGFVGFFTCFAGLEAVINLFRDQPSIFRGVFFGVLVLLTWLVWRKYRTYLD